MLTECHQWPVGRAGFGARLRLTPVFSASILLGRCKSQQRPTIHRISQHTGGLLIGVLLVGWVNQDANLDLGIYAGCWAITLSITWKTADREDRVVSTVPIQGDSRNGLEPLYRRRVGCLLLGMFSRSNIYTGKSAPCQFPISSLFVGVRLKEYSTLAICAWTL